MAREPQLVFLSRSEIMRHLARGDVRVVLRMLMLGVFCNMLLATMSCGRATRPTKIAVIPRLSADAQWLSLHVGIAEEADARRLEPFWHGPSGDEAVQEQLHLMAEAMDSNVAGIIVRPTAFAADSRVLSQALARNIPVVVLSDKIGLISSSHLYYVLENSARTGRLIAERLNRIVGKGSILVVGLEPDVPGSLNRSDAIDASLQGIAPDIHVINRVLRAPRGSNQDEALRKIILEHPDLKAIVALSAGEGLTAAAAISAAGARGRIKIIACDQSIDLLLLLRSGLIDSIVVQQNRHMGAKAVDDIADDQAGLHPTHELVFDPVLVTSDSIDSAPVQDMLLMHRSPPW